MIWLAFALMTAAAVLALVWPLASRRAARQGSTADIRFYADLLQELDGDVARGVVSPADAETTRAEIGRRALAAARTDGVVRPAAGGFRVRRVGAVIAAVLLVPALSVALYLRVGYPGEPDEPIVARADAPTNDFGAAMAKIEAHLAANPMDGRGYEIVAPVYLRMGRADDAVHAYKVAIAILGETAGRDAALGQAVSMAADGIVTTEARDLFNKALALDPKLPQARFFVGLAAEQDGDKGKAVGLWQALLADAPPEAPWRANVEQQIAAASGQPVSGAEALAGIAPGSGAPSGPAAAAIAALPAGQQLHAIRGMVAGLADRLAQNGRDPEGWLRLIKAYSVLGDAEKARTALGDARRALADDPASLARLDAAATELGVGG